MDDLPARYYKNVALELLNKANTGPVRASNNVEVESTVKTSERPDTGLTKGPTRAPAQPTRAKKTVSPDTALTPGMLNGGGVNVLGNSR